MSLQRFLNISSRCSRRSFASKAQASTSLDGGEVHTFSRLSSEWHEEGGPFKALHSLNALRVPWILRNIDKKTGSVADVGCGGGLLSVPLARAGFKVTGIDATKEAVMAACDLLETIPIRVSGIGDRLSFHCGTVEDFSKERNQEFDAVVASEIVEHVDNLDSFIQGCVQLAKPGAPLFFTTINKTIASRVLAIWLAEDVMRIVPRGVHHWEKFVEPSSLSSVLEKNGCSIRAVNGFTYNVATNVWHWIPFTSVNYALLAVKNSRT